MSRPRLRRFGKSVLTCALIFVVVYVVLVLAVQRSVVFPGRTLPPPAAVALPVGVEQLYVEHEQGRTHAYFMPGEGVDAENPGPVVIYAHGNFELAENYPWDWQRYTRQGVSVLVPEFRGYGHAHGSPSKARIDADFAAFYEQMIARPDVDADRVVYHGRSLGGAVVASLAEQHPPAALILESTFTSVRSMAWRFLVLPVLVRDPYDTRSVLQDYAGPVLIVHGEEDNIIPISHAHQNHAASQTSTLHTYPMNHNDAWPDALLSDIEGFLIENELANETD